MEVSISQNFIECNNVIINKLLKFRSSLKLRHFWMVTNLMQLYVLPEAGQVEVLKVKVQKICVLINLIMIFILFYFVFVLNIFYKHCLSSYFLIRYIILITGHYTPTQ